MPIQRKTCGRCGEAYWSDQKHTCPLKGEACRSWTEPVPPPKSLLAPRGPSPAPPSAGSGPLVTCAVCGTPNPQPPGPYGCAEVLIALLFFPIGLLIFFFPRTTRCSNCGNVIK
jgi:hypothetical protein